MVDGEAAQVEQNLKDLHVLLAEAEGLARATVLDASGLSHGRVVVLDLFVATWEVFKGVRVLLERCLAQEALMLSRTLLEDTARLMWLSLDEEELENRALSYSWSSAKYSRDLALAARANNWDWAEEMLSDRSKEMETLRYASQEVGLGAEPPDFPKTGVLLGRLGQERLSYWYARSSQSIHSTAVGVSASSPPHGEKTGH